MGISSTIQELALKAIMPFIMDFIEKLLTTENFQKWGDKIFDLIEEAVKDSETTWDDKTVLPLVQLLRSSLNLPDLPDAG